MSLLLPAGATAASEPEPSAACSRGEALEQLNKFEAAEAAYLEDLKTAAGLKCAPAKLTALKTKVAAEKKTAKEKAKKEKDEEKGAVWQWVETAGTNLASLAKTAGSALGVAVLALLIVVALGLIALQPLTRWRRTRDHIPARCAVSPSFEVKDLNADWMSEKQGAQIAKLLGGLVTQEKHGGATLVTGHTGISETLKPLGEVSEAQVAFNLVSFLSSVLPKRDFEAGGALQPAGQEGRGISIELTNSKRSVGTGTLWGKQFEIDESSDTAAFQDLAVPAAAWVDHQIATALGVGEALLTEDPISWALFKTGASCQEHNDRERAAKLYAAALEIDPKNSGARGNLGLLRLEERKYSEAEQLLEAAKRELEVGKGLIDERLNTDWYRVRFNLAMLHSERGLLASDGTQAAQMKAKAHAEAERLAIEELRLLWLPPRGAPEKLLPRIAETLLPSTLILYATTAQSVIRQAPSDERVDRDSLLGALERHEPCAQDALAYVTQSNPANARLNYNLACAQCQLGELPKAAATLRETIEKTTPDLRKTLADRALTDLTLKPLRTMGGWPALETDLRKWAGLPPIPWYCKWKNS